MSEEVSIVKVLMFNGKAKNLQTWWIWFQAYARVKQFSTTLKDSRDLPDSKEDIGTLDATVGGNKKVFTAGMRNVLAMAQNTMALGTKALLNKINTVCIDEWP